MYQGLKQNVALGSLCNIKSNNFHSYKRTNRFDEAQYTSVMSLSNCFAIT